MQTKMFIRLVFFLCVLVFSSCKKEDTTQPAPGVDTPTGVATPVGTPTGEGPVLKTIGPDGGTIISADERISVIVPAGAVSSNQEFGIEPISNQNPMALGTAYRLAPHGVTFSKPVTIEFSYGDEDVENTIPELLGVAYQDSNRIWQMVGGAVIDKASKKIKVITTHFSDWSLFEGFHLTASNTTVQVGGTVELDVTTFEDLFVPLEAGKQSPMGAKMAATRYIKKWELAGAGNLQADGAKATYKAPSTVPSQNPVTVSVRLDLKDGKSYILVKQILIVADDGEISVRVAGGSWVTKVATPAVLMPDGTYYIADGDGDTQGSYVFIVAPAQLGTHEYRQPESTSGTYVHYLVTNGDNYICQYVVDEKLVRSGGGVTVTDLGEADGFLKGTFDVSPAGHGDDLTSTIHMEGKFRIRIAQQQQ